jgi:hypothetical protein
MGITIGIKAGENAEISSISASGSDQHMITDKERKTFGIEDAALKDAVGMYFGKNPNDVYVRSPTPGDDLYIKHKWPEVQTVLQVEKAKILEITSTPIALATTTFDNGKSLKKATYNCKLSDNVTNSTGSTWSETNGIEVGQKFTYDISFFGTKVGGGETSFTYTHGWGQEKTESVTVSVGSEAGVEVELDPGEKVVAELSASKGVMKVQILYTAHLIGSVAVNYTPPYKDHHFDHVDINDIIKANNSAIPIGDPCGYSWEWDKTEHVFYRSTDGNIHELWFQNGQWRHSDLTCATSAPTAVGDPYGYTWGGTQHVIYRSADSHIHELWFQNDQWRHSDLTAAIIPTSIQFTEDITIDYYSSSKIEIFDLHGELKEVDSTKVTPLIK